MKSKTNVLFPIVLTLATTMAVFAYSCSEDKTAKPSLAVSIEPQRYILENLTGDDYDIVTLMPNGANPETYELSVANRAALEKATACFTTGFFPFENTLALTGENHNKVMLTTRGIDLIYGTHNHEDNHNEFLYADDAHRNADPHVWTSIGNVRIIARNMAADLVAINPSDSAVVEQRLAAFEHRLDSIGNAVESALTPVRGKSFLVWHPSLTYFARDYGLNQIAVGAHAKELSPKAMRDIIDHAREDSVRVFFFQEEFDSRQAEALNSGIGSEIVKINPSSYDWEGQLNVIVNALAARQQ